MALKLEDIIPQNAILKTPVGEFELRKISLADEVWMLDRAINLSDAIGKQDWKTLAKLAYYLLVDKSSFFAGDVESVDDDGRKVKVFVPGWESLLKVLSGPSDRAELIRAIMHTQGISKEIIERIEKDGAGKKDEPQVGQQSLTQ